MISLTEKALQLVMEERNRQKIIYGDEVNTFDRWMVVLTEEVGEVCHEIQEMTTQPQKIDCMIEEMAQVGALAIKIIEEALKLKQK